MSAATVTATTSTPAVVPESSPDAIRQPGEIDSRTAYLGFASAYVVGHGAAALSAGDTALLALPGWLPLTLLAAGLVAGIGAATAASVRAQQHLPAPEVLSGKLLGATWALAFTGLFLAITGLTTSEHLAEQQSVLWATGSGFVVGLVYLAEGAVRRNVLHYGLGAWLVLTSTAGLLLPTPGPYAVLALAGGGAYVAAFVLEGRRLAPTRSAAR